MLQNLLRTNRRFLSVINKGQMQKMRADGSMVFSQNTTKTDELDFLFDSSELSENEAPLETTIEKADLIEPETKHYASNNFFMDPDFEDELGDLGHSKNQTSDDF